MGASRNISDLTSVDSPVTYNLPGTSYALISDETRLIVQWIIFSGVSLLITVFGSVANVINIICFIKQGFKEAVNISLFGLAVSDLCSLVTLIWTDICLTPVFSDLDLPFEPLEVEYLTGAGPHVIFTKITGCITAFITLERCLCVTMPLKVKTIFTKKLVTTIVILIFVFVIGSMLPNYYTARLGEKFSFSRNRTIIGLVFTEERGIVEAFVVAFSNCVMQLVNFIIVSVCTIMLVIKLKRSSKWRLTSTTQGNVDGAIIIRDQKVTKMVVMISTLFIVSFIPACIIMVAMILEPELSIKGKYSNLFITIFSLCFVLESINASVNIFVYYQMSSKYKATLRTLFTCQR